MVRAAARMPFYGDVSGHFRGLLNGANEVCVVGVVGGPHLDCQRCPKRAVRKIPNIAEAKWNELKEVEKRRFFDCFGENTPPLMFGYATFTRDTLHSMNDYHYIYTEETPEPWDVLLTAYAYTEILLELTDRDERASFYADRMASERQCRTLVEEIEGKLDRIDADYASSRQEKGIQAADCLAGGVREQKEGNEPWLDYVPDSAVSDCKYWSLTQLEHLFSEV